MMGAEAYGLIGFFAMLQTLFNILDLGLSPTIARETSRFRAGIHTELIFNQLYRTLNVIFIAIAFSGASILFILAESIAGKWLNIKELGLPEVVLTLQIMAVIVALRWMTGLYKGVIAGCEKLVWLSGFNVLIATLRFIFVFPVMWLFEPTPTVFFCYQMVVASIEFGGLLLKSEQLKPKLLEEQKKLLEWSLKPIKPYLTFALSFAFTSGLWVVVTQIDKLVMSNSLTLEEYGYFTLAVLVATGIMMIGGPISNSILPRMAMLEAQNKREELVRVYRNSTQLITVIAGSVSIMLVFFAEPILYVWTGKKDIVLMASPILQFYAAGYGLIVVGAFPYYLQYAIGKLKLHIIGSFLFLIVLLPTLWITTHYFGMIGAGYTWFGVNLLFFIVWTAVVHRKYAPGLHLKWLFNDILKLLFLPTILSVVISNFFQVENRVVGLFWLILIWITVMSVTAIFCEPIMKKVLTLKRNNEKS